MSYSKSIAACLAEAGARIKVPRCETVETRFGANTAKCEAVRRISTTGRHGFFLFPRAFVQQFAAQTNLIHFPHMLEDVVSKLALHKR